MSKIKKVLKSLFSLKFYRFIFVTLPRFIWREGYNRLAERMSSANEYYQVNNKMGKHMGAYLKPSIAEISKKMDACGNLKFRPRFYVIGGSDMEKQIYSNHSDSSEGCDFKLEVPPGAKLTRDALFELALELNVRKFGGQLPSTIYFGYCCPDSRYGFEPSELACARAIGVAEGEHIRLPKVLMQLPEDAEGVPENSDFPVTYYMFGYPRVDARLFKRIILYRHDAMGDAMLTLPSVRKIRKAFPDADITMVCNSRNTEFWDAQPEIDHVIDFVAIDGGKFLRDIPAVEKLHKQVKMKSYDLSVQLSQDPEHFYIPTDWADFSCGFSDTHEHSLTICEELLPRSSGDPTNCGMGDRIKYLANALYDEPELRAEMTVPAKSISAIESFINKTPVMKHKIVVGIHFGGSSSEREWGVSKFSELIDRIIERFDAGILLIGGKREAPQAREMIKASKYRDSIVSVAGRFSITESAVLMKHLDVFIGNNSGPAHMAGLQGAPVLALWQGSAPPISWTAQGRYVMQVLKPMRCMPCYYDGCGHEQECIVRITVDDAYKAFEKLLCMTGKLEV